MMILDDSHKMVLNDVMINKMDKHDSEELIVNGVMSSCSLMIMSGTMGTVLRTMRMLIVIGCGVM